jgi:hypothetical protein
MIAGEVFFLLASGLFAIPEPLRREFDNYMLIITCAGGVSLALRFLGSPLWAFNRQDISYGLSILSLSLSDTRSLLQSLSPIRRPAFGELLFLGLALACLGVPTSRNAPALIRLLITPALMGAVVWVAWKTILTPELRRELLSRMVSGCVIATNCLTRKAVL